MAESGEGMRRDWDERARKDAFHYIASWRKDWDLESFLASGTGDVARLVLPPLKRCGLPFGGRRMLELGCGAGRMTHAFAGRFDEVCAVDLSREMLLRARRIHTERRNILWLLGNGCNLAPIASASVDFVFSYIVLQHLPQTELALDYIREMVRVLRPGGALLFQYNGCFAPTMNWRGRLAWGAVDTLWSLGLFLLSRALASVMGFDPATAGKSWRGAPIAAEIVASCVSASGARVIELSGRGTPMAWCCARKEEKGA